MVNTHPTPAGWNVPYIPEWLNKPSGRAASIKLIADEWIDYMHLVKLNGSWKIINVLWQYNHVSAIPINLRITSIDHKNDF